MFDFTHGFRSVPIIFATAIHFFQTISNFNLLHAYYGFIETSNGIQDENRGRFVDLAQFFDLNRWATASAFFARSADASMFSELMKSNATPGLFTFLQESGLSNTMEALSSIIKDVDVHHASDKVFEAVQILESKEGRLEAPKKLVLDKICSVFKGLSAYSVRHKSKWIRSCLDGKRYLGKAMNASKTDNCFETLEWIIKMIIDNHLLDDEGKGES